jgi:hypothetical protein
MLICITPPLPIIHILITSIIFMANVLNLDYSADIGVQNLPQTRSTNT